MEHQKIDIRPVLLQPTNFTPRERTPWGGQQIAALKRLGAVQVGESWEISVEPSFPSRTVEGRTLGELFGDHPGAWLGAEEDSGSTRLLVKLLDAAEALSVQIHPSDDYLHLGPDEAGKPEAWYVWQNEPGAGVFLGWSQEASPEAVEAAVRSGRDLRPLMHFVPVTVGDFLLIRAGTPHCVAAGVSLVEPQIVHPGRKGVTYRYWDWNRCYDAQGRLDPAGTPRTLHIERALEVTDWSLPRAEALVAQVLLRLGAAATAAPASLNWLCGPEPTPDSRIGLVSRDLRVGRLSGTGRVSVEQADTLRGLVVLEGQVRLDGLMVGPGSSALLPAAFAGELTLEKAHGLMCAPVPRT